MRGMAIGGALSAADQALWDIMGKHFQAPVWQLLGGREEGVRRVVAAASHPNILVKISGFYYGSDRPWNYPHRDALWIVRSLYEALGAHRLCWGSDYPVVRRALTYRQSIEAFRTHCDFVTPPTAPPSLGPRSRLCCAPASRSANDAPAHRPRLQSIDPGALPDAGGPRAHRGDG